jgi:hypothetical protein
MVNLNVNEDNLLFFYNTSIIFKFFQSFLIFSKKGIDAGIILR